MFGVIVASRPVITDVQNVSENQFAFNIPSQPPFSHIVVFLLPGNALAPGAAAAVYIQIPPATDFKLLGAIANDKQSAIFKVRTGADGGGAKTISSPGDDVMIDDNTALPVGGAQEPTGANIVVGISVEPADNIQAQLATLKNNSSSEQQKSASDTTKAQAQQQPASTKVFAQRIISNAFNYLSSFATGSSGSEVVPLKSFQDWWSKFEKKLDLDPSFLEREGAS